MNHVNYIFVSTCRFDEIVKKFKVEYHAGGATQNSIKIAQVSHIQTPVLLIITVTVDLSDPPDRAVFTVFSG